MIYYAHRLVNVHEDLIKILYALTYDVAIVTGARDEAAQNQAFAEKLTKVQYPNSLHNIGPGIREKAEAIDIAPHPIRWNRSEEFYFLAGAFMQEARKWGIVIRWGGDWDGDGDFKDQSFNDLGHFELRGYIGRGSV